MKRRILTISLIVASLVLLVSVGFAGWIISQSESGIADGNFQAYAVSDTGNLTVKKGIYNSSFQEGTRSIIFGSPSGDPISGAWLTFSEVETESLSVWLQISYSGPANTFNLADTYEREGVAYSKANVNKLISGPTYTVVGTPVHCTASNSNATLAFDECTDGEIIIRVDYAWAAVFGSNPYTYFNTGKTATGTISPADVTNATNAGLQINNGNFSTSNTYAQLAEKALSALKTLIHPTATASDDLKFIITVAK